MTNSQKLDKYIRENLIPTEVAYLGTRNFYYSKDLRMGWAEGSENFSAAKLAIDQAREFIEQGEFKKAKEILSFQNTTSHEDTMEIKSLISIANQGIKNPNQAILKAEIEEYILEITGRTYLVSKEDYYAYYDLSRDKVKQGAWIELKYDYVEDVCQFWKDRLRSGELTHNEGDK